MKSSLIRKITISLSIIILLGVFGVVIKVKTANRSVTGLKVTVSETSVKVTWDKNADAEKYYIFKPIPKKKSKKSSSASPIASTTDNSYFFSNLKPCVVYKFSIAGAYNGKKYDTSTVIACTLPKPVRFTAEKTNDGTLELNWNKRINKYEYVIYTKTDDGKWKVEGVTHDNSYILKNPDCEKYFVTVRARIKKQGIHVCSGYIKKCIFNKKTDGTIYSDGDSIAFGKGSNGYSYADMFAESHNMLITNKAVGGGSLASGIDGCHPIAQSVIDNVNNSYDYIILDGGLNDYYFSAPLGSVSPKKETNFDMNTTCGALEQMLSHIKKTCPNSKIFFVSVHKIDITSKKNDLGLTYTDYKNAIDSICKKYGVNIIDFYNKPFDWSMTDKGNGIHPDGDGIHPTEEGYRKYYLPLLEKSIVID